MYPLPYDPAPVVPEGVEDSLTESALLPADVARKPFQLIPGPEAGPTAPAGVRGSGPRIETVSALPGHLYRPHGAYPWDLPLNRIPQTLAAGASVIATTWPKVPQGQLGVVHKLAFAVTSGNLSDAKLTTLLNSGPVQPYPGVVGAIGSLENPQECFIELAANDVFSVVVFNIGAAPLDFAVRTVGWFYRGGGV